jgi:type VI secretion system protein ImpE
VKADELIRAGNLDEALDSLKDAVRKDPADWRLRVFLFQLLSVLGEWEGAIAQLNVVAEMNADCMLLAQLYRPALNCEALRAEIFAGKRTPLIFGEPAEWVVWLTQVPALLSEGKAAAAAELRDRAFEAAPPVSGMANGQSFEWIADADSRLGPVLEAIVDGKYYWIPFDHIRDIRIEKPQDLRDTVWIKAYFTWMNEGKSAGLIPARYAGSEQSAESAVRLARKTDWQDLGQNVFRGVGQRMLATDAGEYPLLEMRQIALNAGTPAQS